ncbi:MAG: alpha-ketoglutarate-dependent dioxygenase AlkB [Pseudomonadota bacterium]
MTAAVLPEGFALHPGFLDAASQAEMVTALRAVIAEAPLVRPVTAWGKPMSVRMTSAGRVGWVIERGRYRYVPRHPVAGTPWPAIPAPVLAIWPRRGWQRI